MRFNNNTANERRPVDLKTIYNIEINGMIDEEQTLKALYYYEFWKGEKR